MIRIERVMVAGRQLSICLPESYASELERSYPVAYVQDGGELVEHTFNELKHLEASGRLQETIYVGVEPHNRNDEYTPWPASALLEGKSPFGGGARSYIDELADKCKAYIDASFSTKPEPEHTAIIGGSFGGLVSLFAGLWRPEVFGRLGLLSASFWYEGVLHYLQQHKLPAARQRIYMSVGDCEGIYKHTRQREMVAATLAVHKLWREHRVDDKQLCFSLDQGGTHDAHYMALNFAKAMQWLFPVVPDVPSRSTDAQPTDAQPTDAQPTDAQPMNARSTKAQLISAKATNFLPANRLSKSSLEGRLTTYGRWTTGYEVPRTEHRILISEQSDKEYRIFISVPPVPPPENGYPVLYVLDANATFGSFAEAMRLQGRKPRGIEPQVVVGIGYNNEGPIATEHRFMDYTDPASPDELRTRPDGSPWPANGGAEAFTAFIEQELKPCIEGLLPIDRNRQSLFGHSLGGYFAIRTMLLHPASFQSYIAGSPSIWWKNHILYDWLPAFTEQVMKGEIKTSLLLGVEQDNSKQMLSDAEELYRRLKPFAGERLRLKLCTYEGEGHVSMIYPFMSELLRFI
ncbi:hypothetical protein J40TS1_16080 [Paenibacillus montaniterrae]|uniref:Esterase n=1 Tax=Paenibacillus montaniterrae TaxID=429341 RepID=A0A920CWI6_9BACL|nr:alpha/beta hydrolase-fold protein [Paenibacillus montaniterrae]GIP15966.1 hypothetical protein J40TS1_16080 [Paenibacillus montaniterrae]